MEAPHKFADARARRDWIAQRLLDMKGLRFADIARDLGISPTSVSQGLLGTSLRVEQVVCAHLETAHADLFPERYARNGALKTKPQTKRHGDQAAA